MEEAVWLYFSVAAIIVALGVIALLAVNHAEDVKEQHFLRALGELQIQCNYVCDSAQGTSLPVEVVLPSGLYFYTRDAKLCGTYREKNRCQVCNCLLNPYVMELNTSFAAKVMESHKYVCYFTRTAEGVQIDCQG